MTSPYVGRHRRVSLREAAALWNDAWRLLVTTMQGDDWTYARKAARCVFLLATGPVADWRNTHPRRAAA